MTQLKLIMHEAMNSLTVGFNVAWATILAGVMAGYDIVVPQLGNIAVMIGIILSAVLIMVNIRNLKKTNLEIELLQRRKGDKN